MSIDETPVAEPPGAAPRPVDPPSRATATPGDEPVLRPSRNWLEKYALVGLLALLFAVCSALLPAFRSVSILQVMVSSQAIVLLLALTATIVLRTGYFDLSIPAIMLCATAIVVVGSDKGQPLPVLIVIALLFGAAVGAVNAFLIVGLGVDSFVTTLGMFTALTGLTYAITDSQVVLGVPDVLIELSRARLAGLPAITYYGWVLALVLWYLYERTPLGRYMLFIGGSPDAARLAGIRVGRVCAGAFTFSGLLGGLVGVLLAGNLGAIDPSIGDQYLLAPYAAVFLGATAISVGRFNAIGTVVALYLLVVGITGLQLAGAEPWVNNLFNGCALIVAVSVASVVARRRAAA
jgi:ribose transport system permease protein